MKTAPNTSKPKTLNVLLIDDELIQDCLSELLVADGHQVHTASSGGECIAMIRNGILPDIVITDYRLRHLYGIEIVKTVRNSWAKKYPPSSLQTMSLRKQEMLFKKTNAYTFIDSKKSIFLLTKLKRYLLSPLYPLWVVSRH